MSDPLPPVSSSPALSVEAMVMQAVEPVVRALLTEQKVEQQGQADRGLRTLQVRGGVGGVVGIAAIIIAIYSWVDDAATKVSANAAGIINIEKTLKSIQRAENRAQLNRNALWRAVVGDDSRALTAPFPDVATGATGPQWP